MSALTPVQCVVKVKAYTPSDLADLYGISWKVMNKWLLKLKNHVGEREGHYYTPKQVIVIFEQLGFPDGYEE